MSDYKLVNGIKVRACKYGCETELVWSDEISGFIETKGKIAHTQDRCKSLQKKKEQEYKEPTIRELDARLRKLESVCFIAEEI